MARRRRKRSSTNSAPEQADAQAEETPASDASTAFVPEEDRSCLLHPGREIENSCDSCAEPLCSVCTVIYGSKQLCSECFGQVLQKRDWSGGGWRGWCAMGLGFVAIAALSAPLMVRFPPEFIEMLPWNKGFFAFVALLAGVPGLCLGLSSQDFSGMGKRAGAIGFVLGTLSILGVIAVRLSTVTG